MLNIIIISKVSMGMRGRPYGADGGLLTFKSTSKKLKDTIVDYFSSKDIPVNVSIDNFTGDLQMLKKDGADLILISPYISEPFLPLDEEEEKYCLVMTEEAFLSKDMSAIYKKSMEILQ